MGKSIFLIINSNLSIDNLIPITADMESNSITMETLKDKITIGTLDNNIITVINSFRESRKRPICSKLTSGECSIFAYVQKQTNNQSIKQSRIKGRIANLTNDDKLEVKISNSQVAYFLKNVFVTETDAYCGAVV